MILSKSIIQTRNTFLTATKLHKIGSCKFHALQTSSIRYRVSTEPLLLNVLCRLESSKAAVAKDTILNLPKTETVTAVGDALPAAPTPATDVVASSSQLPDIIAEAVVPLNKLGEPTLESIGLGSYYTPVGWVERWLDFVHVTFDLPWWGAIAGTVVLLRLALFPLVIKTQRNAAKMHNIMPEMMALQKELQNARVSGNQIEVLKCGNKLASFMKENNVNPFGSMAMPLIQAPVFLSFFMALKKMAYVPVESMTTGGFLWCTDLTVPDQFYLLPLITSITLWGIIEVGVDTGKATVAGQFSRFVNLGMKFIPLVAFPFMMNFPAGVCCYWMFTNFVSLGQVAFLKILAVRRYFNITAKKKLPKPQQEKKVGLIKDFKSSLSNMKIARDIANREVLDQASFQRAGRMPPAKTYKYNPTLVDSPLEKKKKFSIK